MQRFPRHQLILAHFCLLGVLWTQAVEIVFLALCITALDVMFAKANVILASARYGTATRRLEPYALR
jgi:hypothetical protein